MYKCSDTSTRAFVHVCCLKLPDSPSRKAIVEHEVEKCIFKRTIVSEWSTCWDVLSIICATIVQKKWRMYRHTALYSSLLELKSSPIESHRCGGRTSEVVVKRQSWWLCEHERAPIVFPKRIFFVRSVSKNDLRQSQNVSDLRARALSPPPTTSHASYWRRPNSTRRMP
jgi:hypothetical protein